MLTGKRKRAWYAQFASFPDEKPIREGDKHAGKTVAAASLSSAWLRCGDGFQIDSSLETKGCSEKTSRDKKCFSSLLSSAEGHPNRDGLSELPAIAWSSSESDLSEDENKTSTFPFLKGSKCRRYDLVSEDGCNEDDPEFIDWENDSNCEDDVELYKGSKTEVDVLDILDTESCMNCSFIPDEKEGEPSKTISLEISEFSSDSENTENCPLENEAANLDFPKRFQVSFEENTKKDTERSASDWLKSAQTLLQTPKKSTDKSLRTPEDSAKKRKLLRGGLAERLNRLQNRERATVSFWRHQCTSDYQTPSGDKTGVLIVKILEMHEECSLCIAVCHQLGQNYAHNFSTEDCADVQPVLKVLFAKETAAHLKLALQDVICVHPPWQKLFYLNENIPVILNTYFSQKVILKEANEMDRPHFQESLLTKRNIPLGWIFSLSDRENRQSQIAAVNQASCSCMKSLKAVDTQSSNESALALFPVSSLSDSLLDVVELQGTAGGKRIQVRVVVQRVYYVFTKEGLRYHPQGNNPSSNAALLLNSGLPNVRLCLLIQDAYGMFSEVQFDVPALVLQIEKHSRKWEGKYCILSGIKILQRVTRGRVFGLFSLIDSLWPPLLPLKVPGQTQENEMQVAASLSSPSFCYIFAASDDQSYIDNDDREQASDMYFPPVAYSLKEILQMRTQHQCCSFWAHVIYRRLQASDSTPSDQRQIWLFVTDFSLQNMIEVSPGTPKTLPVSVDSSCVIDVEVMETIKSRSSCAIFFKDALCGNGRIICIERTVLLLQRPLLCRAASADITELTGPVKLDELDFATQVNSICTVRGTVAGVNEQTAFVWPTCNRCGNEKVEKHPQDSGSLYCNRCHKAIISPVLKMHLEVFLHCQSRPQCTVKIKLLQKTISSLLESSSTEDERYEVKSVLGKEVQLLYCFVQSVTSHPFSYAVLEEIVLPDAEGS